MNYDLIMIWHIKCTNSLEISRGNRTKSFISLTFFNYIKINQMGFREPIGSNLQGESMKNVGFLVFAFMALIGVSQAADNKGGLFLEPSLTYERGEAEAKFPSPFNSQTGDVNGLGAGMRLGFHVFESVFIGADGRYSVPGYKLGDQDIDATAYNYGPVVGFQMPTDLGIRVWGTYILGGELDPKRDAGYDAKFEDGSGYRLGGGIKLGVVSLNLEYQFIKYDEAELQSFGPFSSGDGEEFKKIDLENQSWILSVSFPVSL